jgi:lipid A disaccharide synthetase
MLCRFISLPNLMADAELFPEFISNGNPEKDIQRITDVLCTWLRQPQQLAVAAERISRLADSSAMPGASSNAAAWLVQRLEQAGEVAAG